MTTTNEMTVSEAADHLGVHRETIRRGIKSGDLLSRRLSSGYWMVDADSLERFNERRQRQMQFGVKLYFHETEWHEIVESAQRDGVTPEDFIRFAVGKAVMVGA